MSPSAPWVFRSAAIGRGQRALAVAAYRALAAGKRLFLEAPTGIGKTISVLFPAVKTLAEGKFERLFYLTARTVGRTVAEKAFADLRQGGLRLRTLTLTAKDKICFREESPCDPASCPFAIGYYDRAKPAMRAALALRRLPAGPWKNWDAGTRSVRSSSRWMSPVGSMRSSATTTMFSTPRLTCAATSRRMGETTPSWWTRPTT